MFASWQVGCYHHLLKNGYMIQLKNNFGFTSKPQIKSWQKAEEKTISDSDSDQEPEADEILDLCT